MKKTLAALAFSMQHEQQGSRELPELAKLAMRHIFLARKVFVFSRDSSYVCECRAKC
jgi:hypothetical protein